MSVPSAPPPPPRERGAPGAGEGARTAGVYVHIPFCARKCGYCDFNAYSGYRGETRARYVEALCREIAHRAEPQTRVPTVFFGGGTPTTLPAEDLRRILATVRASFCVDADAEVTVEANPGDTDLAYLRDLRAGGFNRISFGVQTFDDRLLRSLDRLHTGKDAEEAVEAAKAAGFRNVSLDLMFALPRQTPADWDRSLDRAFALDIPHLSMYALVVEEGTPFHARHIRGKLPLPGEAAEAAMFARALERAAAAGYERYEISNYAREPAFRSRHNQIYWRNEEYFGFGAGAASYLDGARTMNERLPGRYADTVAARGSALVSEERLDLRGTMGETMMLGLRLAEGVDLDAFARRFGARIEAVYQEEIARLAAGGLIDVADGHLRLTPRGLFVGNEVMLAFL